METINIETSDGVILTGDWEKPEPESPSALQMQKAILLLHMMPATRESWQRLSKELNAQGFATLAIDLRGHGESRQQGEKVLDYKNFEDTDHQASRLDIDAAVNFLKQHAFDEQHIAFVGASIGANLALEALSRYSGATNAVLLSPGLNYRGVATEMPMKNLAPHQRVAIFASAEDEYSAESAQALHDVKPNQSTITIFAGSTHGTDMYDSGEGTLVADIVQFLS